MTSVALLQLDASDREPVAGRVSRVLDMTAGATLGADLVLLPELWHIGAFATDAVPTYAEPIDGELVTAFSELAARTGTWLHVGSFAEVDSVGRHFNTSVLLDPSGAIAAIYRKIHLFGFTGGETTIMRTGGDFIVVPTVLGQTGIATCYDLRFPELFRGLLDRSATATLIASGWPTSRISHWSLFTRARAVENQMFVIACNEVGEQRGVELGGHSVVVSPAGDVLAEAGAEETILRAEVDPGIVERYRAEFPVLADRRRDLYGPPVNGKH